MDGYGVMGSSLGGSMALFTALRLPQVFPEGAQPIGRFHCAGLPIRCGGPGSLLAASRD